MSTYNEWPPPQNYPPPQITDRWQRELVRIAGWTPNGLPKLRLEWGSTCTWTVHTKDLKYLHRRQDRQIGWTIDYKDRDFGSVLRTRKFGLRVSTEMMDRARSEVHLGEVASLPYPDMLYGEEIGIPRWWIAQWFAPSLVGSDTWAEARQRIREIRADVDMGAFPREGLYYLGFHPIWDHDSGRKCCSTAKDERRKCFGHYRPPAELDLLYVESLWKKNRDEPYRHDWTEAPDDLTMYQNLKRLAEANADRTAKEREEMRLRIRDTYNTHKARFTSRKGVDTFIIHRPDNVSINS